MCSIGPSRSTAPLASARTRRWRVGIARPAPRDSMTAPTRCIAWSWHGRSCAALPSAKPRSPRPSRCDRLTDTIPVRPDERFAVDRVATFLCRSGLTQCEPSQLEVEQFPAGQSNLTYLLRAGEWEAVLRRPPLGPVAPRAHDMAREFHILQRLHPSFPLAPKP